MQLDALTWLFTKRTSCISHSGQRCSDLNFCNSGNQIMEGTVQLIYLTDAQCHSHFPVDCCKLTFIDFDSFQPDFLHKKGWLWMRKSGFICTTIVERRQREERLWNWRTSPWAQSLNLESYTLFGIYYKQLFNMATISSGWCWKLATLIEKLGTDILGKTL